MLYLIIKLKLNNDCCKMKNQKRNSIQISFPADLYNWIAQKTEDPMNYTVNTYSGFVISCVEMVKALEEKKRNKIKEKNANLQSQIDLLKSEIIEIKNSIESNNK